MKELIFLVPIASSSIDFSPLDMTRESHYFISAFFSNYPSISKFTSVKLVFHLRRTW